MSARTDHSTPGHLTWISSEPDGGPDCGIALGLGNGATLYVGEISCKTHAEGGDEVAALGGDRGWWLVLHPGRQILGRVVNAEAGLELMERLSCAIRGQRS